VQEKDERIMRMAKSGPIQFFRQVRQEGNKVTWPSRRETVTTTIMVFIMVFFASMFLFVADWIISAVIEFILTRGA